MIFTENFTVYTTKLTDHKKIVELADLHIELLTSYIFLDEILDSVFKIKPDYITMPGDFSAGFFAKNSFDNENTLKKLFYLFNGFKEVAPASPVILSLGNHDLTNKKDKYLREIYRNLKNDNVYPLDNASIEFEDIYFSSFFPRRKAYVVNHVSQRIANMVIEDWNQSELKPHPNKFSVLLEHFPDLVTCIKIINEIQTLYQYDVVLSAHNHNGGLSNEQEQIFVDKLRKLLEIIKDKKILCLLKKFIERNHDFETLIENAQYYGWNDKIWNLPPFTSSHARGKHQINGTEMIVSKGLYSKGKEPYITEIDIVPQTKQLVP